MTAAFGQFVAHGGRYELVYGSLSGAVLFLLWLQYNACLVLWGSWFLRLWRRDHGPSALRRRLSPAGLFDRLRAGRLTRRPRR